LWKIAADTLENCAAKGSDIMSKAYLCPRKKPTCMSRWALQLGSTLDAAGGETAGQVLFDGHEQDHNGNDGEDGSSEQVLPLDDVVAVEDVDAHGQRLDGVGGDQAQCHGVFIPCIDEDEDQGGDDAGGCHRQQDLEHGLDPVAAVDSGSLLHLCGDGHEGAAEQPDGEGLVEGCVDEDQTQQGIGQSHGLHDLVDTDQQNHGSKHLGDDDEAQECGLTLELHTGQGIGGGDAADHSDGSGTAGDDDGVQHVLSHGSLFPDVSEVGPQHINREDSTLDGENLLTALQSGADHDEVRVQNHNADQSYHEVQQDPANELTIINACRIKSHDYSSPFFRVETM